MKKLAALIAGMMLFLGGCAEESVSVGVIGGADGPTAVFVSAAPFWWAPPLLIVAMIAAAAIIIVSRKKKR